MDWDWTLQNVLCDSGGSYTNHSGFNLDYPGLVLETTFESVWKLVFYITFLLWAMGNTILLPSYNLFGYFSVCVVAVWAFLTSLKWTGLSWKNDNDAIWWIVWLLSFKAFKLHLHWGPTFECYVVIHYGKCSVKELDPPERPKVKMSCFLSISHL